MVGLEAVALGIVFWKSEKIEKLREYRIIMKNECEYNLGIMEVHED